MKKKTVKQLIYLVVILFALYILYMFMKGRESEGFQTDTAYDIVIIAGQSNAQGNGEAYFVPNYKSMKRGTIDEPLYDDPYFQNDKQNTESPNNDSIRNKIFQFTKDNTIKVASDPIDHFPETKIKYKQNPHGFGIPFARQYIKEKKGDKVLLLGCAMGSTAYSYYGPANGGSAVSGKNFGWQEGNSSSNICDGKNCSLFKMSKLRIDNVASKVSPNSRVVAILWHQGENDYSSINNNRSNYKNGVSKMLKNLRTYAKTKFPKSDANFPVLLGGLSPLEKDYYERMTPVIKELVNENSSSNFRFVPSDDELGSKVSKFDHKLRPNSRNDFGGKVHFSRMGQIEFGYRYYYVFNNNSINFN
jgi:hypothetical protein